LEFTNYQDVVKKWKDNCDQFGKEIEVILPAGKHHRARFHDINSEGHLIYQMDDGSLSTLTAGEIKVL